MKRTTGIGIAAISTVATGLIFGCSPDGNTQGELTEVTQRQALSLSARIVSGSDDAEESTNGSMYLNSSDLELVRDGSYKGEQTIGLRFQALAIPHGASITGASIEFTVDETDSGVSNLTVYAHDVDNAPAFTGSSGNISSRVLSTASVNWSPGAWNTVGQKQSTPELAVLVQEVVNRSGWVSGNHLAFVFTGSGERTAESFEGSSASAALLRVDYETDEDSPVCGDQICEGSEDCSSCSVDCGACETCSDGILNQDETNIDCGGVCESCGTGGVNGGGGSSGCSGLGCGEPTTQNLLVAFIGDQGNNGNSTDVLELIAAEGADAVVHNGDFDYQDNPTAWDNRITNVLGDSYPYFAIIGNHDAAAWNGSNGYAAKIQARHGRNSEMQCSGELGVQASCNFRGLHMIQSCVGTNELRSSCGANNSGQLSYLQNTLAASSAIFKVCNWHKNQHDMQVGTKPNEVGWQAYQVCMNAGAMVSTGHEHSYSRTLSMTDVGNASAGHGATGLFDLMTLAPGVNFAFVSGLAGVGLRTFSSSHNNDSWWASYYTSDRWYENGVTMSGVGDYGALFIRFYVDGDPTRARAYFKDVNGRLVDEFDIQVQ